MTADGPPDLRGKTLDFSQFHDLMHRPFSRDCRELPGGWRRHLELWWEYRAGPELRALTFCWLGRHRLVDGWRRASPADEWQRSRRCRDCGR